MRFPRFACLLAIVAFIAPAAVAAPFTYGNIVVYRVGSGSGSLVNTGNAVFLDEFTPSGTLVQSIALPTTASGSQRQLIASGTATSEGLLTLSADGNYLVATGYARDVGGTGSIGGTTSAAVNRVVGRIDAAGAIDTTTALTDYADGNNPRGAVTTNGTDIWVTGGAGGIRLATFGSTTSTQLSTTVTNLRQPAIFAGQLYVSTSSGSAVRIGTVGTGTPTTAGQVISNLPGIVPNTGGPYAFALLDLDAAVAGVDTMYVADDTALALTKYSLVGGNWTANGTVGVATDTYRGLAARASGNTVTLFLVRKGGSAAVGGGELVTLVDASGYNGAFAGTPTLLATAAANTAFRGVAFAPGQPPIGPIMRITEYMYGGANGEFVEFTNVGDTPANLAGWSFDDDSRVPGTQGLSAYGVVQPGESVILAEAGAATFTAAWNLCPGVKVIGGLVANLGRNDEINLFDGANALADRLTFGDETFPGTIRANGRSGWVSSAGLGTNTIAQWTLSTAADGEASVASVGGDIGSPGRSTRATFTYDPCASTPGTPVVTVAPAQTSPYLSLEVNGAGAASGVLGDPTDPAATTGIGFTFADSDGDPATLTVTATSSNATVVAPAGLDLTGSGATRQLKIIPAGVGLSTITVRAQDATGKVGSYVISYAASAATTDATMRFHAGASDASTAQPIDAQHMLVADDENQVLRLYRRDQSGLHLAGFDFTSSLGLTDISGGFPREVDIEGSTRVGDRIFWIGSHGNQASSPNNARPNRRRLFATDLTGAGIGAQLAYAGRYDFLVDDLVAWDATNGHGLGANALGFAAATQPNVPPETATGFNIEALSLSSDGTTLLLGFRAPRTALAGGDRALVVPLRQFDALVTGGIGGSLPPGSAQFGAPVLLDLGGRAIRSLERATGGRIVIAAGPSGSATGTAPNDFRLFAWSGAAGDAPLELVTNVAALNSAGSLESIVDLPAATGDDLPVAIAFDDGDTVWYANGVIAKDLGERRHAKFRSIVVPVDFPPLADPLFSDGFESP